MKQTILTLIVIVASFLASAQVKTLKKPVVKKVLPVNIGYYSIKSQKDTTQWEAWQDKESSDTLNIYAPAPKVIRISVNGKWYTLNIADIPTMIVCRHEFYTVTLMNCVGDWKCNTATCDKCGYKWKTY